MIGEFAASAASAVQSSAAIHLTFKLALRLSASDATGVLLMDPRMAAGILVRVGCYPWHLMGMSGVVCGVFFIVTLP